MSQQRFIRCKHCNLPHEAELRVCPLTGDLLETKSRRDRPPEPPPSEEDYAWEHSVHPSAAPIDGGGDLHPSQLDTFIGLLVEGKYRIEALIGRGGMGAVFRAVNERIGKPVALKILYRGYAKGSESERRFRREARVASSLGHPNIVEVFDLGQLDDGKPFQVMELLEGHSLAARIQAEGALPEAEVIEIAEQLLSALEAAHEGKIVHRDIKPENVFLIQRRGVTVTKLLDFGVSKILTEQTLSLTKTGVVVGTPYYLSPEQARGMRDIDHRVDLWAMGVLLYESLTGVLPFNAKSYDELLRKILGTRPVPPSKFQPRLTPDLEAIVLRALSASRDDRPQSAAAMLDLLRQAKSSAKRQRPEALGAPTELGATSLGSAGLGSDATEVSDSFIGAEIRGLLARTPAPEE